MDQKYQAFILTAETLSMTRAAEIACVSHQCISTQIRSLENRFGVALFQRKPKLALTPDGQMLLDSLYEIRRVENNIENHFQNTQGEITGTVRLGIPSSRYGFYVPKIVKRYKELFPAVDLEVIEEYSAILEWQLERGMIDMSLVFQQEGKPNFVQAAYAEDTFLLVVPEKLFRETYGEQAEKKRTHFSQGMQLTDIQDLPLIIQPKSSRMRGAMDEYAKEKGIRFRYAFYSNRYGLIPRFCRDIHAAGFLPTQMRETLDTENRGHDESSDDHLLAFPIDLSELNFPMNVMLIYHKSARLPSYKMALAEVIKEIVEE